MGKCIITVFSDMVYCLLSEWCVPTSFYQRAANHVSFYPLFNLRILLYLIRPDVEIEKWFFPSLCSRAAKLPEPGLTIVFPRWETSGEAWLSWAVPRMCIPLICLLRLVWCLSDFTQNCLPDSLLLSLLDLHIGTAPVQKRGSSSFLRYPIAWLVLSCPPYRFGPYGQF